jgi:thioredoxin-like negative regulator of GroEL
VCSEVKEDEFLRAVTSSKLSACVFEHKDFPVKCAVLDAAMRKIAPFLTSTRLIKLDADKAPFIVARLKVRVIPTTVFFVDGMYVNGAPSAARRRRAPSRGELGREG